MWYYNETVEEHPLNCHSERSEESQSPILSQKYKILHYVQDDKGHFSTVS